jgi:ATP-binding cassette subfamily C protein CydC
MDLSAFTGDAIREKFSVVHQRGTLFNDTIRANLLLGNPLAAEQDLIRAAQKARISRLINSLPEGYDTRIGERGFRLSAGERQRIQIARAVLKDAPIFLLDEPTANLDPLTEKALLETLFEILKEKTAILITHRLVGLDQVDQILVVDRGRIIERGTEKDLLASGGFYARMFSLQNRILRY